MQVAVESIETGEAQVRGVLEWPLSSRGVSRYTWHYDATEICYIAEGRARIETEDGNIEVEKGDLVTLPAGLECAWVIQERVVKHYRIEKTPS